MMLSRAIPSHLMPSSIPQRFCVPLMLLFQFSSPWLRHLHLLSPSFYSMDLLLCQRVLSYKSLSATARRPFPVDNVSFYWSVRASLCRVSTISCLLWAERNDLIEILSSPAASKRWRSHTQNPTGMTNPQPSSSEVGSPMSFLLCKHFGFAQLADVPALSRGLRFTCRARRCRYHCQPSSHFCFCPTSAA